MSQFVFPPLTANLNSEASNGGSLPSSVLVVAGYDGANVRAIKTDSTGEVAVDVSSSALPSGAATSALQTAGNNLLTTIDADTSSLAGAISGTEMQVDIVASLPAGTNNIGDVDIASALPAGTNSIGTVILGAGTAAIGKLSANSGVDIGDVDVTSLPSLPAGTNSIGTVILGAGTAAIGKLVANDGVDIGDVDVTSIVPGVGATNLGKAIQSAQGATDTGVAALVVRNDTLADLSGADGDYAPLQVNASGALYTAIHSSALPTGAATEAKQDVIETTLNSIEGDTSSLAGAVSGTEVQVDVVASLPAGTNNIGDVDIASALPAGTNNIGDVDIASALPAGTNSIGTVVLGAGSASIGKLTAIAPVDFLDSGLIDTSTAAIASTGTTVVSSLAAACTEIEIQEDIGEFMSLRVGGTVKAFLPLGGGRVKVSLAATDAVQLFSETGTAISSGKIAINFLG
jgi:hypothetical protein